MTADIGAASATPANESPAVAALLARVEHLEGEGAALRAELTQAHARLAAITDFTVDRSALVPESLRGDRDWWQQNAVQRTRLHDALHDPSGDPWVVVGAVRAILAGAPEDGRAGARSTALFQTGEFRLHSGAASAFKIDCDALTDADWQALSNMIADRVGGFTRAVGVPRGGLRLAASLNEIAWEHGPILIVDDVLTTGASMEAVRADLVRHGHEVVGAVVFARGPVPAWVTPLFVLSAATEAGSAADAPETTSPQARYLIDTMTRELLESSRRVRVLEGALRDVMALIGEGLLVRNTTNDAHFPSYVSESSRIVKALAEAQGALAEPRGLTP